MDMRREVGKKNDGTEVIYLALKYFSVCKID